MYRGRVLVFDLVHYGKLFKIIISKDLSKSVICLYFDSYLNILWCFELLSVRIVSCFQWSETRRIYLSKFL